MNWKKFSSVAIASTVMMFAACSSDSSSNPNRESESSSSKELSSSSSEQNEDAEAIQALVEETPNMLLTEKDGADIWLIAGSTGIYSLWAIDPTSTATSYATVATKGDITTGKLEFSKQADGFVYSKVEQGEAFAEWLEKGITLEFSVKEGALMVSIDGADPVAVEKATRKVTAGYLSKADSLVGKSLEWSEGDSTQTYRFYKNGEYVRVFGEDNLFEAGYYDVHRQQLLMLPVYFVGRVSALTSYSVKLGDSSYELDNQTSTKTYKVSSIKVSYPEEEILYANSWESTSNDTLLWTLDLLENSRYVLEGKTGVTDNTLKVRRKGEWDVFGDYLVLAVDTCQATEQVECPLERGQIVKLTSEKLEIDNFDEASKYAAPKEWTPVIEE
ncbi:MAG: hypothetical protein J6Z31_10620 [Fibrobacter sp.]|nr:hypothetical protein [Fibrobacter sp.]